MLKFSITGKSPVRAFQLTRQDNEYIETLNNRWDVLEVPRMFYRYDVGEFVAGHLEGNEGRYQEVLERIAEGMPHHPSTMRTWSTVAMRFAKDEFRSLVYRKTAGGNRLYWSHFVHLARVRDVSMRERLTEEVFAEDLRTAELRERIRAWEADNWQLPFRGSTVDDLSLPQLLEDPTVADTVMIPFGQPAAGHHELAAGAV